MRIKELYDRYLWEKCWLSLFYKRMYKWLPLQEAIKPVEKKDHDVRSKLFADELEWYYKQPEPKADKAKFYWRLFKWYTKEQAIKESLQLKQRQKKKPKHTPAYIPVHSWTNEKPKQDESEIRITYKKEEADVFRKEYEWMINDLERVIVEDEQEAKSIKQKIDDLKKEYFIFIKYNYE